MKHIKDSGTLKDLGTVGLIGRFRPLHNGAVLMLETACERADFVKIGVGSVNKYNARCPFTPQETKDMIDLVLKPKFSNYEIVFIPDSGHIPEYHDGSKWVQDVKSNYGKLDHFITGNPYVADLLKNDYDIIHPGDLIPPDKWIYLKGTMVRMYMALNEDYKEYLPEVVYDYILTNGLDQRFRREFGEETLRLSEGEWKNDEGYNDERKHVIGK